MRQAVKRSQLSPATTQLLRYEEKMETGMIAAIFSLATLALSRCRFVVRKSGEQPNAPVEWACGFTEHQLLPERPKPTDDAQRETQAEARASP